MKKLKKKVFRNIRDLFQNTTSTIVPYLLKESGLRRGRTCVMIQKLKAKKISLRSQLCICSMTSVSQSKQWKMHVAECKLSRSACLLWSIGSVGVKCMHLSIVSGVRVHVFQSEDKQVQQKCSKMLENTCKKEGAEWKLRICGTNAIYLDLN